MSRSSFRQADIQRLIRAAVHEGAAVQVDLKSLIVSIVPGAKGHQAKTHSGFSWLREDNLAPDGKENWNED